MYMQYSLLLVIILRTDEIQITFIILFIIDQYFAFFYEIICLRNILSKQQVKYQNSFFKLFVALFGFFLK